MIDIETLSTRADAAILSIAAVRFDLKTGKVGPTFYERIANDCNKKLRRHIDPQTVRWWMNQKGESIYEAFTIGPRVTLQNALLQLTLFITEEDGLKIWANSPSFDLVILKHAYEQLGMAEPWEYWQERDVRTLASLNKTIKNGTENKRAHHPLADCTHQIEYCSKIIQSLNL